MQIKSNQPVLSVMFIISLLVVSVLASCSKETAASPTGLGTQINIINASPDAFAVDYYIAGSKKNTRSFIYGTPSGYIYIASLETPLQIRSLKNRIYYSLGDTALRVNTRYSFFLTGLLSDNTLSTIFLTDTSGAPALGRAKVRFLNASAKSVNVDVFANNTQIFKNIGFKGKADYTEFPAGVYDFKVYGANSTTVLFDLPNTTLQDGRLYTLYTQGVVGRTDSAAFSAAIITNK